MHELGVADLEKIQDERARAAEILGHPDAATAEAAIAEDPAFRFTSPDQLKATAEEQVRRSWDLAPSWFGRIPSANCEVRLVEEFREADMPFAFYNPPTEDGSRPGVYYVNGFDLERKPKHQLASTTYHEANPGHHFQVALEQEMEGRPALRRFGGFLAGSAFTEGWGLYSERLADEMGLYLDEAERLGMLDLQGMRAARLVVDTGIHALGWTRERAIETLRGRRAPRRRGRDRDRPLHHDARAGALVQDRAVRDRAPARGGVRTRGRRVLARGVPRPAARARIAPAHRAPARAGPLARRRTYARRRGIFPGRPLKPNGVAPDTYGVERSVPMRNVTRGVVLGAIVLMVIGGSIPASAKAPPTKTSTSTRGGSRSSSPMTTM